jgi:hypothetical protein
MKKLITFWLVGRILDLITTYIGLTLFGLKEANPIASLIFQNSYIMGLIFLTLVLTIIFIVSSKYVIKEGGKIGIICLYIVIIITYIPVLNNMILLFSLK